MSSLYRDSGVVAVRIAQGQTKSETVRTPAMPLFGLVLPSQMTGTELSFEVAIDPTGPFQALYDANGTLVRVPNVAGGRSYALPPELAPWACWRIVSNAAEAAERTLKVVQKG